MLLTLLVFNAAFAQDSKQKVRISAQYTKVMPKESFISISVKYKAKDGFEPAANLEINVYTSVSEDSLVFVGKTSTGSDGKARFPITLGAVNAKDTSKVFTYVIKVENNSKFDDNETSVRFSVANLTAELETVDGVSQVTAVLSDASGNPLPDQTLTVGLKRMYGLLQVGEESYKTNESGSVTVPLPDSMPGIDGKLTFEVALNESDTYGNVKALVNSTNGIPVKDQSSFDQRTMWSPPLKAPLYLLVFPNLIILGVWIPLLILIFNLFRISRSG